MPGLAFVDNIEELTLENTYYRNVAYTTPDEKMQLVFMSLKPNEEIGEEIHATINQFFRIEKGNGKVVYNDGKEKVIKDNDAIIIPAGMKHNIINTGSEDLKLYTIYTPANHPSGLRQKRKPTNEAESEKDN
jgi:mannose-6-phosphate isomerase-like protein (cupin superfamily)